MEEMWSSSGKMAFLLLINTNVKIYKEVHMFDLILSNNVDALVDKVKPSHCSTFNVGVGYILCICHDVYIGV